MNSSKNEVAAHPSTTAGESTASESGKSTRMMSSRRLKEKSEDVLELKFPRCCVCGVDWYDADDEDDKKPSASGLRTSPTKLYPLPQCQCSIKLSLPFSREIQSTICNENYYTHKSPQDVLDNIYVYKFRHLAVCRPCLEKKIDTSEEVLTKDYQQNDVANGQRDVKYSIPLKCDFCSQKFMKRKMEPEKLEELGKQSIDVKWKKKESKTELNWFDSVESTIHLIGWMKRQKRRAKREARRSTRSGEDKKISRNWWVEVGCSYDNCSSDECYALSSDSDLDGEKKQVYRQIAQQGEIGEEYHTAIQNREDERRQQVLEDEELARKIQAEMEPAKIDEEKLKQEEADRELAKKWQGKENDLSTSTPSHREGKRKADTQPINSYFSKQCRIDQNSPEAPPTEKINASTEAAASIDLTGDDDLDPNVTMLMEMGYSRIDSENCLKDANYDVNVAASMLLSATAAHNAEN